MDILILAPLLSVAIVFIVLATRLWRTSLSTTIHALSVATAIYCYASYAPIVTIGLLLGGVFFNMIRGVINTDKDTFVKRSHPILA